MKSIKVVAAVLVNDNNKILCTKRRTYGEMANKWEFPGGKIEEKESHQMALFREIEEELAIEISIGEYITTVNCQYKDLHIEMHAYFGKITKGEIVLLEHQELRWLKRSELNTLDWATADIPIVEMLMTNYIR